MAENLVQVGAVFDGTQLNSAVKEATATVQQQLAQMQAAFNKLKADSSAAMSAMEARLAELESSHVTHMGRSREAVGGLKLAFDDAGIAINRHVAGWLASIPGLSAFGAALPVFAVISLVDAFSKFVGKSDEAKQKFEEGTQAAIQGADALRQHAVQVEIDNLKLTDQIATLNKLPSQNGVKIAAIEAKQKVDELIDSLGKAIVAEQALFKSQVDSTFSKLIGSGTGQVSEMASHFQQGLQQMKQYEDDWHRYENIGDQENATKFKHLFEEKEAGLKQFAQESIQTLKDIQSAAAPTIDPKTLSPDAERAKAQRYAIIEAYQKQQEAAKKLLPVVQELYGAFIQGDNQLKAQVTAGAQQQIIAGLEQATKNYDLFKAKEEQALQVQIADVKAAEAAAVASFTAQGVSMDQAKVKADALYSPQILQARLDFYAKLTAAAVTQAEKDRIAGESKIVIDQEVEKSAQASAQMQAHLNEQIIADNKKQVDDAISGIDRQNKALLKAIADRKAAREVEILGNIESSRSATEQQIALIEQELQEGKISKQKEIELVAKAKQEELAAEIKFHQAEAALWDGDLKKVEQIQNQITKAQHQQILIQTKAVTDSIKAQQQQYQNLFSQLTAGFNKSLNGIIENTQSISKAFASMYDSILTGLIGFVEKWIEKKAEMWLMDKIFHLHSVAAATGAATGQAMTAAFASVMAGLPFPANVAAAPAVAAAAGAEVGTMGAAALGAVSSSAGGAWMIDSDRLNFVHRKETILPADKSMKLDSMLNNGSGHSVNVSFSVTAMDSASFKGQVRKHAQMIGNEVARVLNRKRS